MFDFSTLFISVAHAAEAVPPETLTVQSEIMKFVPLFLIFMVFYVLLIRPQQKKESAQEKVRESLKKGDKVLLTAGLFGTIAKAESGEEFLWIELAKGVQVKVLRSAVAGRAQDENGAEGGPKQ